MVILMFTPSRRQFKVIICTPGFLSQRNEPEPPRHVSDEGLVRELSGIFGDSMDTSTDPTASFSMTNPLRLVSQIKFARPCAFVTGIHATA